MLITTNQAIRFFLVLWSVLAAMLIPLAIMAWELLSWHSAVFVLSMSSAVAAGFTLWSCRISHRMQNDQQLMLQRGEEFEAAVHAVFKAEGRLAYAGTYSKHWEQGLARLTHFVKIQTPRFRQELVRRKLTLRLLRRSFALSRSLKTRRGIYARWRMTVARIERLLSAVRGIRARSQELAKLADAYLETRATPTPEEFEQALHGFTQAVQEAEAAFLPTAA